MMKLLLRCIGVGLSMLIGLGGWENDRNNPTFRKDRSI